jgi:hypothetical protein
MDPKYIKAHEIVAKARESLRRGDKGSARKLGEQVALLVPEMEDAWLVLAASDPNPQDALAYARKALELKPDSTRAQRAVEWASGRLKQAPAGNARVATEGSGRNDRIPSEVKIQKDAVASFPRFLPQKAIPQPESKPQKRGWVYAAVLGLLACMVLGVAWSAISSPVFASLLKNAPVPTEENLLGGSRSSQTISC